ncbi:MAG: Ref family recombination enhancement nuclease [Rickettsiales bacterium]|nr:Ref family recombination enhancement nuclease [Rickettsiales bacterium]
MTTKSERERMDKISQMECVVCGDWPVEVHHTDTGMGRRKDHNKTIPLCTECHRGDTGLGGMGKKAWQAKIGKTESELLAETNIKLNGGCHVVQSLHH